MSFLGVLRKPLASTFGGDIHEKNSSCGLYGLATKEHELLRFLLEFDVVSSGARPEQDFGED